MTVVALGAATFGPHVMRDQPAVAGGIGLFVALGSALFLATAWSACWHFRAACRGTEFSTSRVLLTSGVRALGALAALAVLVVGAIRAVEMVLPRTTLQWVINLSTSAAVPIAALVLLLAGLSHMPWRSWLPAALLTLLPPLTACWTVREGHTAGTVAAALACLCCTLWCAWRWHVSPVREAMYAALPRWQASLARVLIALGVVLFAAIAVVGLLAQVGLGTALVRPWLILGPVIAGVSTTAGAWALSCPRRGSATGAAGGATRPAA